MMAAESDLLRSFVHDGVAAATETVMADPGSFVVTKAVVIYEIEDIEDRYFGMMWENCREWDMLGLIEGARAELRRHADADD
jgi:hypothetical protein